MKKSVVWLGSLAVVLALGFSGYAGATSTHLFGHSLLDTGYAQIGGPLLFFGGEYNSQGGPVGQGTIGQGHRCGGVQLDPFHTDGAAVGNDFNREVPIVTLNGLFHNLWVTGAQVGSPNHQGLNGDLSVCLNRRAPSSVTFNYLIVNVGWTG